MTADDELIDAISTISQALGPVRHLVNVVGGVLARDRHRALEYDMTRFDRVMDYNLRYLAVSCREVAQQLEAHGWNGSIVNLSSVATRGFPLRAAYAAAKAGIEAYSRTVALEWSRHGIRVNVIAPEALTPRAPDPLEDPALTYPLGRRATCEEVANVALLLVSDLTRSVTGQVVYVDGGASLTYGRSTAALMDDAWGSTR